jgi:DNA-binding NarL/FixJ family response regulator
MSQSLAQHHFEPRAIRVLLVCNERVIRAGLRALIDGQIDTIVIGEVDGLDAAREVIAREYPDVTVLDPDHYPGDRVGEFLRAATTPTRIILLTGSPDSTSISSALENGAAGLVLKQQSPEFLVKAINRVYAGELWLDRTAAARLIAELSSAGDHGTAETPARRDALLTNRERQVIKLVSEGLRNSQIAKRLLISEITVRNHLTSVFRKLDVANRFQLVTYAFQHGLAALPTRADTRAQSRRLNSAVPEDLVGEGSEPST